MEFLAFVVERSGDWSVRDPQNPDRLMPAWEIRFLDGARFSHVMGRYDDQEFARRMALKDAPNAREFDSHVAADSYIKGMEDAPYCGHCGLAVPLEGSNDGGANVCDHCATHRCQQCGEVPDDCRCPRPPVLEPCEYQDCGVLTSRHGLEYSEDGYQIEVPRCTACQRMEVEWHAHALGVCGQSGPCNFCER